MNLAKNLYTLRDFYDYSQKEVAQKCDITQPYYSRIENGIASPSIIIVVKMAELFRVSLDDLVKADFSVNEKRKVKNEE